MATRRFELSSGTSNKFWEVAHTRTEYTVSWGRIGAAGSSKTKKSANPAKEVAALVAEKVGKGYREVSRSSKGSERAPRRARTQKATNVSELLEQLRSIGVRVKTGPNATATDVAAFERKLGFEVPASHREFLGVFGEIRVVDSCFYGVTGAVARNKAYAKEFAGGDDGAGNAAGSYVPKRFVVLSDRGDYSNAGEGWVFDADLDAILATDGARWIERDSARKVDYWDWLAEELQAVHAAVSADRAQQTQIERSITALTTRASRDSSDESERLYDAFADYDRPQQWHCYNTICKACDASNRAFDKKPLRALTAKDLDHYVDNALGTEGLSTNAVRPRTKGARQNAFKHFLPRCLEHIGDLGCNRCLRERAIFERGFLTPQERRAVDAWLMSYWHVLLQSPETLPVNVTILLRCVADLEPYLAAWESSTNPSAQRLRAVCSEDVRGGDSLLANDCFNSGGEGARRAKAIARWLSPDWVRRIFG